MIDLDLLAVSYSVPDFSLVTFRRMATAEGVIAYDATKCNKVLSKLFDRVKKNYRKCFGV